MRSTLPHDPANLGNIRPVFSHSCELPAIRWLAELKGQFELTENSHRTPLGQMRKVPLLRWDHQLDQMVTSDEPPRLIHARALLETDVPWKRTFAVQVRDDSMQPLFSEGEIIFVNPDLPCEPGHYVVVE